MTRLMEVKIKIEKCWTMLQCAHSNDIFLQKNFFMVYFVANQTVLAKNIVFDQKQKKGKIFVLKFDQNKK